MGRARMSIVLLVLLIACKLGDPARSGGNGSDNSATTTKPPESTTVAGRSSFGGEVEHDGDQLEGMAKGSTTPSAPVASQLDGRSSVTAAVAATTDNLNDSTVTTSAPKRRGVNRDISIQR